MKYFFGTWQKGFGNQKIPGKTLTWVKKDHQCWAIKISKLFKKTKQKNSSDPHRTKNDIQGNWSLIVMVPTDRFLHGLGITLGLIKARATSANRGWGGGRWRSGPWGEGSHIGHIATSSLRHSHTHAEAGSRTHTHSRPKTQTCSGALTGAPSWNTDV